MVQFTRSLYILYILFIPTILAAGKRNIRKRRKSTKSVKLFSKATYLGKKRDEKELEEARNVSRVKFNYRCFSEKAFDLIAIDEFKSNEI